jgi:hypothetical protein
MGFGLPFALCAVALLIEAVSIGIVAHHMRHAPEQKYPGQYGP